MGHTGEEIGGVFVIGKKKKRNEYLEAEESFFREKFYIYKYACKGNIVDGDSNLRNEERREFES
jgi:hypothetical protein